MELQVDIHGLVTQREWVSAVLAVQMFSEEAESKPNQVARPTEHRVSDVNVPLDVLEMVCTQLQGSPQHHLAQRLRQASGHNSFSPNAQHRGAVQVAEHNSDVRSLASSKANRPAVRGGAAHPCQCSPCVSMLYTEPLPFMPLWCLRPAAAAARSNAGGSRI